ncbi:c-type cytochrome biogenesis protein CcmI [Pseudooceanicola sp. C21-150M6]|uniref:c-type cytochrome biogenesis protein CcmI n=1 Tax=Pseudooceanicola sp. C21-150M6 TaxID=3434355 RepID=UPI003D7F5EB3
MLEWTIPALMSLAVAALIGLAVWRARSAAPEADGAPDMLVYRNQLREVEKDAARGTIAPDEAERLRAEIARRLIAADTRASATAATSEPTRLRPYLMAVLGLLIVGGSLALYARIGVPGYQDMALEDRLAAAKTRRETRPDQAQAENAVPAGLLEPQGATPGPEYEALIQRLRDATAERPDDLQGQELLARNEAALGNYKAAYTAAENILRIKGAEATSDDYLTYADLQILAAGGYVSPEAENALRAALARDPENGAAKYYMGLMLRQNDRPDIAFRLWDQLLRAGPEDSPWIPPIRAQIDEAARLAGVEYEQPRPAESLAGPTAEDVANAQDMTAEDRQEMIRGMVSRLSERLATQGGSPEEWARLIRAYGVLGEVTRARAIADEARQVFAAVPEALAQIEDAAASLPQDAPAPEASE